MIDSKHFKRTKFLAKTALSYSVATVSTGIALLVVPPQEAPDLVFHLSVANGFSSAAAMAYAYGAVTSLTSLERLTTPEMGD